MLLYDNASFVLFLYHFVKPYSTNNPIMFKTYLLQQCYSKWKTNNTKITSYIVFYVLLQVLRPGVLWFLRNLNDPDFNPVQEMIHLPIYRHLRRFILSVVRMFLKFLYLERKFHMLPPMYATAYLRENIFTMNVIRHWNRLPTESVFWDTQNSTG